MNCGEHSPVTVVCFAEVAEQGWRWVASYFSEDEAKFDISLCPPNRLDKIVGIFSLARLLNSMEAIRKVRRNGALVLVTHGPTLAAWCAIFSRLLGVKVSIVAHSFNFSVLPGPIKRAVFRIALSKIERFVVFSQVEKEIYSKAFDLPTDRFDFIRWGVQVPSVETPACPMELGNYVAAVGGNARDYRTLIDASLELPEVRFVLVVRPESLHGLKLPPNVSVHTNMPFGEAMNILLHSRFMVLPLIPGDVPCGHVTLVAAMHLGKAIVVTDSPGVTDYIREEENAIMVESGSVKSLVAVVRRLWEDHELCNRLGENGRAFAAAECTEQRIAEHFRGVLYNLKLHHNPEHTCANL
jgi:glycosyltransferase involved in cell wall biosynthesis